MNLASIVRLPGFAIAFGALLFSPSAASGEALAAEQASSSALLCLRAPSPVACLEGTDPAAYPAGLAGQIDEVAGLEPLGKPGLVDPGEEAYRAFLALVNAGHSLPPGQDASALFKAYVDRTFRRRVESMYVRAWQMELLLTAMRLSHDRWASWRDYDANLEDQYRRQYPAFEQIVQWSDPEVAVNCAAWLARALTRNAEYLAALGKWREAQRMLFAAEDTFSAPVASSNPAAILALNTFGRFVLAGWRDVDEPVTVVEQQLSAMSGNVAKLTPVISRSSALASPLASRLPAPGLSVLAAALLTGRTCRLFPHAVLRFILRLPGMAAAGFPLAGPGAPFPSRTLPGEHAAEADELAAALNLPLSLAPVSPALAAFLAEPTLPRGDAVLLGSGDGSEPRAAAANLRFTSIVAVDHSGLAVERIREMTGRLAGRLAGAPVHAVLGGVVSYQHSTGAAGAVVASHLLEYLGGQERVALLERIARWLMPGGKLYAAVHLAAGERYDSLLQYGNVAAAHEGGLVTVTISHLVPSRPDATQVQHFFTPEGIRQDLHRSGLTAANGFAVRVDTHPTTAGFVEAVILVTRLK